MIVASHLIDEYQEGAPSRDHPASSASHDPHDTSSSTVGAVLTALAAFLSVSIVKFLKEMDSILARLLVALATLGLIAPISLFVWAFFRLQHIRSTTLTTASLFITALGEFELVSSATLSLIQEVELVSKGYRISSPLPPVTRLDDSRALRRCIALRRRLHGSLVDEIARLRDAIDAIRVHTAFQDLDKYLDIYDVPRRACHDALARTSTPDPPETDHESLGELRLHAYKRSLLRRYYLCCLLAVETSNDSSDFERWHSVTLQIENLASTTKRNAHTLNSALADLSAFVSPSSPKPPSGPAPHRIRAQLRQIGTLSQGIRSIHAKMALMREESNRAIEDSDDLTDLGPVLLDHYESVGVELRSLLQDWQAGKAALSSNIERHERRASLISASPPLMSPTSSLGGSTAVSDLEIFSIDGSLASGRGGGPADALRTLNGGTDAHSEASSGEHEQVFEGIAPPRKRTSLFQPGMSRADRIARQNEERARQAEVREKRQSNGASMIRELQTVINLRRTSMPGDTSNEAARRWEATSGPLSACAVALDDALGILTPSSVSNRGFRDG